MNKRIVKKQVKKQLKKVGLDQDEIQEKVGRATKKAQAMAKDVSEKGTSFARRAVSSVQRAVSSVGKVIKDHPVATSAVGVALAGLTARRVLR